LILNEQNSENVRL